MQEIHAVLIDLENSLLNQFGDIPPATMSVIQDLQKKGIVIGLMSGRNMRWVRKFLSRKRIEELFSFVLASNGSEYLNIPQDHAISLCSMTPEEATQLTLDICEPDENAPAALPFPVARGADIDGHYVFDRASLYAFSFALRDHTQPLNFHGLGSLSSNTPVWRLLFSGSKALISRLAKSPAVQNMPINRVAPTVLEVFPKGSSFMSAFEQAKTDFHLQNDSTLTFASLPLEKELLSSTYGIALKNSPDEVKACAKRVTKYNPAQNGIAYMINVLLMGKEIGFRKPQ